MTEYTVHDPRTGELVRTYPTAGDADIAAALESAERAYRAWGRTTSVAERVKLLRRVAELHEERREELADAIVLEMGKPRDEALGEVEFSAAIYGYYADRAETFLADEPIELLDGDGSALIRRSPVGVLLGIMPWNFPCYQVARFAAPNLATGNSILLKHAPQCPVSAELLQRIFLDAGLPEGAYVNIYATNEQVADIIADPRVQGVSLTGSERAGAAVAEIAGRNLKKVVLEPGRDRAIRRRRPHLQHGAGVQRRQAVHRHRGAARRVRRALRGRACGDGVGLAAVLPTGSRHPGHPGGRRGRAGRDTAHRR